MINRCNGILGILLLCLATQASATHPKDPWESFNRKVYAFNEVLDDYLLKPIAKGYRAVTPSVVDKSITNFFNNIGDVANLGNSVLQLKHRKAAVSTARIVFNTVFGIGGLFDVATAWDLPREDEDFGQTLNYWGVPEGNYLMLPFLGPATVTDAIGKVPDNFMDPLTYAVSAPESYAFTGTKLIDVRADLIPAENLIVGDEYTFVRNAYLQRREFVINDGEVDDPFADDDFDDF